MLGTAGQSARGGSIGLGAILREYSPPAGVLSPRQRQAVLAITRCRTADMGGRHQTCNRCGHREAFYNSCRDRHCPNCQAVDQARWVQARLRDLLPVEYFHVVFTIPSVLHPIFRADLAGAYGHLIKAASETLLSVAANPDRLGARVGFTTVLHTWTQLLTYHPHVHVIVPNGGLSQDGSRWISPRSEKYFLPEKILATVFRGKLLSRLEQSLVHKEQRQLLTRSTRSGWVVYCKPPFTGPEKVVRYLGRYTHRIAFSNGRIVSLENGTVTFRYRDRSDRDRTKTTTLSAGEFVRRFLQHVVPKGFVRIRHHGFLANSVRRKNLDQCRKLLGVKAPRSRDEEDVKTEPWNEVLAKASGVDPLRCPKCEDGKLVVTAHIPPSPVKWAFPGRGTSP